MTGTSAAGTGAAGTGAARVEVPGARPWQELLGLVLPVRCAGCGRLDAPWCTGCARALLSGPAREVHGLAAPALGPQVPTWCAAPYTGAVREVLIAWKEHGRHDVTGLLAAALAPTITEALRGDRAGGGPVGAAPVLLVAVPSSRAATARRGGALVQEMTAAASRRLRRDGVEVRVPGRESLRLSRALRDQSGLGAQERSANLSGAHRGDRRVQGRPCLLVDDIATTGATLAEAARAVRSAGGHVVAAATVAATPRGPALRGPAAGGPRGGPTDGTSRVVTEGEED